MVSQAQTETMQGVVVRPEERESRRRGEDREKERRGGEIDCLLPGDHYSDSSIRVRVRGCVWVTTRDGYVGGGGVCLLGVVWSNVCT